MTSRSLAFALPATLAGVLALTTSARAADPVSTWEIDPTHSSAEFSIRHMMVSNVKGHFGKMTGEVTLDEKDPTKSSVNVEIDASTIDTREPKRDAHLKSPDFFDVAKYPKITFKSTKVEKAGKGKLKVIGDLTMRGVTKPVTLAVEGPTAEVKDIMGGLSRGASATAKINRKDWGLTWNKPLEAAGGVLVGDDVTLSLDVELHKKMAPAAAATAATTPPAATAPPPAAKK
jgi:polyisoprenoid-binding protein YceI